MPTNAKPRGPAIAEIDTAPAPPERRRRPSGPVAREQMRASQRLRLALAMIDAVGDDGYRATRVADVIARAGVSRKTFYELFDNKQDCMLATYELIVSQAIRQLQVAFREADGWPGRVEAAIGTLFASARENPGAMRLSLLEIAAVGPPGIDRRERSIERYERFIRDALELAPGDGTVAETVLKAVIGGLNRVLYRRVLRGQDAELLALVPDLTRWATSYYPTPPADTSRRRPSRTRSSPTTATRRRSTRP